MQTAITTVSSGVIGTPFGGVFVGVGMTGFEIGPYITSEGSVSSASAFLPSQTYLALGGLQAGASQYLAAQIVGLTSGTFTSITAIINNVASTYGSNLFSFFPTGTTSLLGVTVPPTIAPIITVGATGVFASTTATTIILTTPLPVTPPGHGDITDPEAWQDASGNIPPHQFSQVPFNVIFP